MYDQDSTLGMGMRATTFSHIQNIHVTVKKKTMLSFCGYICYEVP